jgi:hypothetical protein
VHIVYITNVKLCKLERCIDWINLEKRANRGNLQTYELIKLSYTCYPMTIEICKCSWGQTLWRNAPSLNSWLLLKYIFWISFEVWSLSLVSQTNCTRQPPQPHSIKLHAKLIWFLILKWSNQLCSKFSPWQLKLRRQRQIDLYQHFFLSMVKKRCWNEKFHRVP